MDAHNKTHRIKNTNKILILVRIKDLSFRKKEKISIFF